MLDDYKDSQPIVYKILKNAIMNDQCSHAYLIETGGFYDSFNFIISFTKSLLCPFNKLKKENWKKCHQCEVIDTNNFPEIEIIKPDGLWIKKEQLQNLQKEFNTKALIGNKRIYIIEGADKLNKSAANSILKFLEEPEGNIIAILMTDNIYNVLTTIRSRCQILRLKKENFSKNQTVMEKLKQIVNLDEEELETKIEKVIEFVNYYERNHLNTMLYIGKLWNDYIKDKQELTFAYEIMINYYKDILNYKLNKDLEIFEKNKEIEFIASRNETEEICKKIDKLVELKELIKYNINSGLLMDKLIMSLEGVI